MNHLKKVSIEIETLDSLNSLLDDAESLLSTVYLIEKGDAFLTCLLCGRKGDHSEDVNHLKSCWFARLYKIQDD